MHCRSFLHFVHGVFRQTIKHLYIQTLSSASARKHMCLQALLVPVFVFERVPGPWDCQRFLLPPFIRPFLLVFYRYSSPRTPSIAHDARLLVTCSVFDSLWAIRQPRLPQHSSQTAAYAARQLAHLFSAASHSRITQPICHTCFPLFRYFPGHSCIHTHARKLTCAISQTWRICSCGLTTK